MDGLTSTNARHKVNLLGGWTEMFDLLFARRGCKLQIVQHQVYSSERGMVRIKLTERQAAHDLS
jgi:hypothetical protein